MCSSSLVCRTTITQVCVCACVHVCQGVWGGSMASLQFTANGREWRLVQMAHHYGNPLQKHPSYSHRRGKREEQTGEKKGLEINSKKLSAKDRDDGRWKKEEDLEKKRLGWDAGEDYARGTAAGIKAALPSLVRSTTACPRATGASTNNLHAADTQCIALA